MTVAGTFAVAAMGATFFGALARAAWDRIKAGADKVDEDAEIWAAQQRDGSQSYLGNIDAHHDYCWGRMSLELRRIAVESLRCELSADAFQEVVKAWRESPSDWWAPHHMFAGRQIRNLLRERITDEELPLIRWDDGNLYRNWDDFWVRAVECAAGIRSIDGTMRCWSES